MFSTIWIIVSHVLRKQSRVMLFLLSRAASGIHGDTSLINRDPENQKGLLSISSLGADELAFESESDVQEQEEESSASISSSASESGAYERSTKDNDSEESLENPGRRKRSE